MCKLTRLPAGNTRNHSILRSNCSIAGKFGPGALSRGPRQKAKPGNETCGQKHGFARGFYEAKVFGVATNDVAEFVAEDVGELRVVFDQAEIVGAHPNVARPRDDEAEQHGQ